ncbi:MAG: hypothetical protein Q8M07_25850 [Prosthecobacter sp.]|nr:hypothetical protein [Prosthecobacter sp.]
MKTPCLLVGALTAASALASCVCGAGTSCHYQGSRYSNTTPCHGHVLCDRRCPPQGTRCATCACPTQSCVHARVRTRTDWYEGVSRYPSTWGAPETTTVTTTTYTWVSPHHVRRYRPFMPGNHSF